MQHSHDYTNARLVAIHIPQGDGGIERHLRPCSRKWTLRRAHHSPKTYMLTSLSRSTYQLESYPFLPFTPAFTDPPGTWEGTMPSMTFKIPSSRSSLCLRPTSCKLMGALLYVVAFHCPAIRCSIGFLGECGKGGSRANWEAMY